MLEVRRGPGRVQGERSEGEGERRGEEVGGGREEGVLTGLTGEGQARGSDGFLLSRRDAQISFPPLRSRPLAEPRGLDFSSSCSPLTSSYSPTCSTLKGIPYPSRSSIL